MLATLIYISIHSVRIPLTFVLPNEYLVVYKEVNVMIKLYNSNVCYCSCMFV